MSEKTKVRLLQKKGIEYKVFYTALGMSQAQFSMYLNEVKRGSGSPHHHKFTPEQLAKMDKVADIMNAALQMIEKL